MQSPQSARWCDVVTADYVRAVRNRQTFTITLILQNKYVSVSTEALQFKLLCFTTAVLTLKPLNCVKLLNEIATLKGTVVSKLSFLRKIGSAARRELPRNKEALSFTSFTSFKVFRK